MKLTRNTNYALRLMMYCAANPSGKSRIGDIARAYNISEAFLFKILQPLVENGLLITTRGRSGGVSLARSADLISILDIIRLTEANFAMAECFDNANADCPLIDQCSLNSALNEALAAFFGVLEGYTIRDLVKSRPSLPWALGLELAD